MLNDLAIYLAIVTSTLAILYDFPSDCMANC